MDNLTAFSQAGRRGFESRLPLHRNQQFVNPLPANWLRLAPLVHLQGRFELIYGLPSARE